MSDSDGGGSPKPPPEGAVLRDLLDTHYTLVRSTDGRIFGTPNTSPGLALKHAGNDSPLVRNVCMYFLAEKAKFPNNSAIAELSAYVNAVGDTLPATPVPIRCHWDRPTRSIYIDTCDRHNTVLQVNADGVTETVAPVPFRRSSTAGVFPWTGQIGGPGDLEPLWPLARVTEVDRPLVLALLVSALWTETPQPVVLVTGPQDAGKTSTARYLVSLIDPTTTTKGRSLPPDEREWKAAVAASRVVLVDNISAMSSAASDTLCRVATGGEAAGRALYSDDGSHSTNLHVPVWMTSISTGILRGDLASRMVRIELEALDEDSRMAESDLLDQQEAIRPQVTRGLLWLAHQVLARWDITDRTSLSHRMGDFAVIVRIIDELLGTGGERRLVEDARDLYADVADASPIAQAVLRLFEPGHMTLPERLTMAELLERLNRTRIDGFVAEQARDQSWPRTPGMLSAALQRVEPALRKAHGIEITRTAVKGKRFVSLARQNGLEAVA